MLQRSPSEVSRGSTAIVAVATLTILAACSSKSESSDERRASLPDRAAASVRTVSKVVQCARDDHPETALQGQVPAALRASGFNGFNCNLKLAGRYQGGGGGFIAAYTDRTGHRCAYQVTATVGTATTGKAAPAPRQELQVVDLTDPANPKLTASLTTMAVASPWESLRVNPRRGILAATAHMLAAKPSTIDLYDLSKDCRHPQLRWSGDVGTGSDGGIKLSKAPVGHEGNFSPDGLTYYVGDVNNGAYNAVDVSDLEHPKVLAQFDMLKQPLATNSAGTVKGTFPGYPAVYLGTAHGLSISENGNRGFFVSVGYNSPVDLANPSYRPSDGFYVVDTSEVQTRKPNPQMRLISATSGKDGTMAQHTIPIAVGGKPYLVFVDEGGAVYSTDMPSHQGYVEDLQEACRKGLPLFPMTKIFDLSDEQHPREVSALPLETHDPAHCNQILPDLTGLYAFTYGSHYCSVDNRQNATALACSYQQSGIRVFDIRNPSAPKEIAYYNPPGVLNRPPGVGEDWRGRWQSKAPDWCASQLYFDFDRHTLTAGCESNGVLVMQFGAGVWPMRESSPTTGPQN